MLRSRRPEVVELVLSDDERDQLVAWSLGSSRLGVRARIVLACAESGVVYEQLAADLGVTTMTVGKWRRRFAQAGLAGLVDDERTGRPKSELVLSDDERAQLTRWSRRAKASEGVAGGGGGGVGGAAPRGADKKGAGRLRGGAKNGNKWGGPVGGK